MKHKQWEHELFPFNLHEYTLPSGLSVWAMPTKQARYHAALTVHFGALDLSFESRGKTVDLPAGVAHFLEHQMFTTETGDAFDEFARLGASANAYTGYEQTTYLFSTAEEFYPSLALLLTLVRSPGFDKVTVEKERGIIEQELRMYDDMPYFRVNRNLRQALYSRHHARFDVGGSVESIGQITADHLWEAFGSFYQPHNMVLFVAGDFCAEELGQWLTDNGPPVLSEPFCVKRLSQTEPSGVVEKRVESVIPVAVPIVQIGFKDVGDLPVNGTGILRQELVTSLVHHALFGKSSILYEDLYRAGLAGQLSADFESGPHYGLSIITAETDQVEATLERVLEAIDVARTGGMARETATRGIRRMLGNLVSMFNHPESVGQFIVSQLLREVGPLTIMEILPDIEVQELNERLREHLDKEQCAVSIVTAPSSTQ